MTAGNKESTVLFVDDEPEILDGIRVVLRNEPYRLLGAGSGREALALLGHTRVDVVVSDERMPEMCGSELLALVCKKYPETVRIILTGQASLAAAIRAINEGRIYRFLTKPCNPVELAQAIRQGLQLRQLTRTSSRLLSTTRRQRSILRELESQHPGIATVNRADDGAIVIDEEACDLDVLLKQMNEEVESFQSLHEASPSNAAAPAAASSHRRLRRA